MFRLDTRTGVWDRMSAPAGYSEVLAGDAKVCDRALLVADYVDDEGRHWIQIGRRRFPNDGGTTAAHQWSLCGIRSNLELTRGGAVVANVSDTACLQFIPRQFDGAYRDPDRGRDFLLGISEVVNDSVFRAGARTYYRRRASPSFVPSEGTPPRG